MSRKLPAATREAAVVGACGHGWATVAVVAALTYQTRDSAAAYLRALERQHRLDVRFETVDECAARVAAMPRHAFTKPHRRRALVYRAVAQAVAA